MGKCPEVPTHPSPNFLPAPPQEPGGGPNLEVGLLEDAGQLGRGAMRKSSPTPPGFPNPLGCTLGRREGECWPILQT